MKRFIATIIFVSVFFIGVGSIIEKTSAKFKSDEKAIQLIKQSRIAIGGDTNINAVRSMSIVGTTTNFFEKAGIQDVKQGSLEINFEMPNRFSKMVKIGDPENSAEGATIRKEINVVVTNDGDKDFEFTTNDAESGNNKVFIVKKGEGEKVDWISEDNADIKVDGDKVIFKKDDGTVEEIKTDGKSKVIIKRDANGNVLTEDIVGPQTVIVRDNNGNVLTENLVGPNKIIVKEDVNFESGNFRQNEMLRMTMGLLMTASQGSDVIYKFLGVGNVDGNTTNMIGVESNGSSFKLHLDAATNLPRMISYTGQPHRVMLFSKDKLANMPKEKLIEMKTDFANAEAVEHQIRFSDFRTVGNLTLPYRWSESVGGKQTQTTDVTSYEINPANIADKFGKEKVFIRKMKPTN